MVGKTIARPVASLVLATAALAAIYLLTAETPDHTGAVVMEGASPKASGVMPPVPRHSAESTAWKTLPDLVKKKHELPRKNYKGDTVTNDFCGGTKFTKDRKCSEQYQQGVIMTSMPVIICCILTTLIMLGVFIGRCFLPIFGCFKQGCCGGRVPSKGFCYGDRLDSGLPDADGNPTTNEGYTVYGRRMSLLLVLAMFILVVIAMCIGHKGNKEFDTGINSLLDTTIGIPKTVKTDVEYIAGTMKHLQAQSVALNPEQSTDAYSNALSALKKADNQVSNMTAQANKAAKFVRSAEKKRTTWFHFGLIVPVVLSGLAVLGYFCPCLVSFIVVPCVFLTTIVVWVALAVHIPAAVGTADFCVALDYGIKHPNATNGALDMILKCGGKGFSSLSTSSNTYIKNGFNQACTTLNTSLCLTPSVTYVNARGSQSTIKPVTCPTMECNADTLGKFINNTIIKDFQWGCAKLVGGTIKSTDCKFQNKTAASAYCQANYGSTVIQPCVPVTMQRTRDMTIPQCAGKMSGVKSSDKYGSGCLLPATKKLAQTVAGNYDMLNSFQTLLSDKVEPLVNCSTVRRSVVKLEKTLCWDVLSAVDYIIAGLAIIAITFFFGNGIYMGASKRFNRQYWDINYAHTELERLKDESLVTDAQLQAWNAMASNDPAMPLMQGQDVKQQQ